MAKYVCVCVHIWANKSWVSSYVYGAKIICYKVNKNERRQKGDNDKYFIYLLCSIGSFLYRNLYKKKFIYCYYFLSLFFYDTDSQQIYIFVYKFIGKKYQISLSTEKNVLKIPQMNHLSNKYSKQIIMSHWTLLPRSISKIHKKKIKVLLFLFPFPV